MENIESPISETLKRTLKSNNGSCGIIIPKRIAKEEGIDTPSYVLINKTAEGILIQKLVLKK